MLEAHDLAQIHRAVGDGGDGVDQGQPIAAHSLVFGHHQHSLEEGIDGIGQSLQGPQYGVHVPVRSQILAGTAVGSPQVPAGLFVQGVRVYLIRAHLVDNRTHDALAASIGDQSPFPVAPFHPAL
jgi:hypothetical protein